VTQIKFEKTIICVSLVGPMLRQLGRPAWRKSNPQATMNFWSGRQFQTLPFFPPGCDPSATTVGCKPFRFGHSGHGVSSSEVQQGQGLSDKTDSMTRTFIIAVGGKTQKLAHVCAVARQRNSLTELNYSYFHGRAWLNVLEQ
jgi:hypothetical protein